MRIAIVLIALTFTPSVAAAFCAGKSHDSAAISCAEGTAFDRNTGTCVPVTG